MKTTSNSLMEVHIQPGGPGPINSNFCSMSIPLTVANFFKSDLLHKSRPGGDDLLLQNVQCMVTPTNHAIAPAGITLSWTPGNLGV